MSLMGYSHGADEDDEKFSLDDFVSTFDIQRVHVGGPVWDISKLNWLNARYIREDHTPEQLQEVLKGWLLNDEYIARLLPFLQDRLETLGDFIPKTSFFFANSIEYKADDLVPKKSDAETTLNVLQTLIWHLEKDDIWTRDHIRQTCETHAERWEMVIRDLTHILFVSLTGRQVGPPLYDAIPVLGKDRTLQRLRTAVTALGGVGKKKLKKLEKKWAQLQRTSNE